MTWEPKRACIVRRSFQDRFIIYFEQMDLLSEEAEDFWNEDVDELEDHLTFKQGFAKELLAAMDHHLSVNDLKQIVEVFSARYEEREAERLLFVNGLKEQNLEWDVLMKEVGDEPEDEEYYCWEEADWLENRVFYEYELEYLEDLPTKERIGE